MLQVCLFNEWYIHVCYIGKDLVPLSYLKTNSLRFGDLRQLADNITIIIALDIAKILFHKIILKSLRLHALNNVALC